VRRAGAGLALVCLSCTGKVPDSTLPPLDVVPGPPGVIQGSVRSGSPEGPLKDVLVRVLDPTPSGPPAAPLVLEERGGRFVPELGAVVAGQGVVLRAQERSAPHAWTGKRGAVPLFHVAQPPGAPELARTLPEGEGPVRLQCAEHPTAVAHLYVQPNGQFDTTDEAGHFELRGVAAGFHTLEAWRPGRAPLRQTVEVPAGGVRELQLLLPTGR